VTTTNHDRIFTFDHVEEIAALATRPAVDDEAVQARRLAEARQDAEEHLASLLAQAARTDLDDDPAWAHLRATAHATVAGLIAQELLPEHLRVRHHDDAVVVARTLAAAWRRIALR
jgi:hypothetical protein